MSMALVSRRLWQVLNIIGLALIFDWSIVDHNDKFEASQQK